MTMPYWGAQSENKRVEEIFNCYSLPWSQKWEKATPKPTLRSPLKLQLELPTVRNVEDVSDSYLLCTLQYLWKYWDSTHAKGKANQNQH